MGIAPERDDLEFYHRCPGCHERYGMHAAGCIETPIPPEPLFHIQVNEAQCTELSFGRVPGEVQEMARTMVDWTQEHLRKNAAKPVQLSSASSSSVGLKSRTRGTRGSKAARRTS